MKWVVFMNKVLKVVPVLFFVIGMLCINYYFYYVYYTDDLNNPDINILKYDNDKKIVTLSIDVKDNDITCIYNETKTIAENKKCVIEIPYDETEFTIKNKTGKEKDVIIDEAFDVLLNLDISDIYIAENDTYKLKPKSKEYLTYESLSDSFDVSKNGVITSHKKGDGTLKITYFNTSILVNIHVTDLIVKAPKMFDTKKEYLPCHRYSKEEAKLLDEILYFKIDDAGYKTRAGAVEAARFLSLEFPYKISYFFENGRVNDSGVNLADGEGRYYKRGLYLNEDKFSDIKYVFAGPAIWGCPLTNYEDAGIYKPNTKWDNGLDCSGFVSWALLNGGFDVGDRGAGETYEDNQMTDLGERVNASSSLFYEGKVKAGDLINWWGHIGIIVGIDDKYYYVAESLDSYLGLEVKRYKIDEAEEDWTFIMLLDEVYKEDGNYTDMWY